MEIYKVIKEEVQNRGVTQTWVVNQMNYLDKSLNMTNQKMSAILNGRRELAGDEFIAVCKVLNMDIQNFADKEVS